MEVNKLDNKKIIAYTKKGIALRRLGKLGKRPAYKGNFKQGDSLTDLIRHDGNIGILTGRVSGLICVDIDRHGEVDGVKELREFLDAHQLKLPRTRVIESPNHGLHYYYKLPEKYFDTKFKPNSDIIKGVDFRNHGQFMVAEDSEIITEHGSILHYKVVNDIPFDEIPEVPEWLIELYSKGEDTGTENDQVMTFIAKKMTEWTLGATEGNRNNWLAAQVGFMFGQRMTIDKVVLWANIINNNFIVPKLDQSEVNAMIESIHNSEKYKRKGEENA